ncbi:MAG: glycolate oxidase binding subunit [Solirubrobacteraceae bacterium]|jgi:glycolate oxidase FAD binding subunit|nr:glycolate oxidase binding subunit [Solirubrobacteraceae bacterium]
MAPAARTERPGTVPEVSELLRSLGEAGEPLRVRGGATKDWGAPAAPGKEPTVEISTAGMARILEHNEGDFTAILEPGVPVAEAQAAFASAGQMLALDPPLGIDDRATIGGLVATADSGPLRHRYGGVRDLIVGITVVLSDGTVARAGGKVIKNVAGYDLAKLFTGSHGTLGYIASVSVRLHPAPGATATARGVARDPDRVAAAAAQLAVLPLEADCLDVAWGSGRGAVLARFGGAAAEHQAQLAADRLAAAGLDDAGVTTDDDELWAQQRARQRAPAGAVLKVAGTLRDLPAVLRAAEAGGATTVARAALGLSWIALDGGDDLAARADAVRAALPAGAAATVLDGGQRLRDPWPAPPPAALAVMERIKARFDPAQVFRPGAFAGGI